MLIKYDHGQEPSTGSGEAEAFRSQYDQIKKTEEQHLDSAREWASNNPDLYDEASKEYEQNALDRIYQAMNMQNYDLASAILSDLRTHKEGKENDKQKDLQEREDIHDALEKFRDHLQEYISKAKDSSTFINSIAEHLPKEDVKLDGFSSGGDLAFEKKVLEKVNNLISAIDHGEAIDEIRLSYDKIVQEFEGNSLEKEKKVEKPENEIDQIKQASEELRDYLREYMNKTRQTADELRDITRELGGAQLDSDFLVNAEQKLAQVNDLLASINQGASTESIKEKFNEIADTKKEVENDGVDDSEVGEDGEIKQLKGEFKAILESRWDEIVEKAKEMAPEIIISYLAGLKSLNPARFENEGFDKSAQRKIENFVFRDDFDRRVNIKLLADMRQLNPSMFEQMKSKDGRFKRILDKTTQQAEDEIKHGLSYNIAAQLINLQTVDPDKYREIVNSDDFKEASEYFLNNYCSDATYPDDSRESPPLTYGFRYKKLLPEFKFDPKRTLEKYKETAKTAYPDQALMRWQDAEFAELKGGE